MQPGELQRREEGMTPVQKYCDRWKNSSAETLEDFTRFMVVSFPGLCLEVLNDIGMFPSSEPELRELQRRWRG